MEPATLGWVLGLAGVFLLAVAMLAPDPLQAAALTRESGGKPSALRSAKALIFQRAQLALGFLFLLLAVALGLAQHVEGDAARMRSATVSIGAVLVATLVLEVGLWWWAKRLLKRHVDTWIERQGARLEIDPVLAREIGDLFGVEQRENDTIESYAERVRKAAGLGPAPKGPRAQVPLKLALAPESDFDEE